MTMNRRRMLAALASAPVALGAGIAEAAPMLSETNYGLTLEKASRGNGWLEIDAAAFEANIASLRALIGPAHEICVVMKADAYGHSIALLIPSIVRTGVRVVGLTSNEEARVARALGYKGRIVRLRTGTLEEIEDGLSYGVEELTGNPAHARAAVALAARWGRRLDVHFALNSTGMGRNGLDLTHPAGRDDAKALMAIEGLRIVGVMSHFPVEDVADMAPALERFLAESDWVIETGGLDRRQILRHVANSWATLDLPDARLDMVRAGGVLYGDSDPKFTQFRRLMTAKSRVACVNFFPAGSTVSYDRTYKLTRDSWLANIPAGYSDGYRRGFSHRNQPEPDAHQVYVLIRGHRLPVMGRVTMNTVMVDVTDVKDQVQMDDEVVFFGRQGSEEISQAELETAAGTIGAELYTIFGTSMPKVLKA